MKPTNMNLKKTVYLMLTIVLVSLLMLILHSFLELWYINSFVAYNGDFPGQTVFLQLSSYLPPGIPVFLLLIAIIGGFFLGQWWWRIVYIEKRHWRWRRKLKGR